MRNWSGRLGLVAACRMLLPVGANAKLFVLRVAVIAGSLSRSANGGFGERGATTASDITHE
jgi:hypothetical protein